MHSSMFFACMQVLRVMLVLIPAYVDSSPIVGILTERNVVIKCY